MLIREIWDFFRRSPVMVIKSNEALQVNDLRQRLVNKHYDLPITVAAWRSWKYHVDTNFQELEQWAQNKNDVATITIGEAENFIHKKELEETQPYSELGQEDLRLHLNRMSRNPNLECRQCGDKHRNRDACPAKSKSCRICGVKGHFGVRCPDLMRRRAGQGDNEKNKPTGSAKRKRVLAPSPPKIDSPIAME